MVWLWIGGILAVIGCIVLLLPIHIELEYKRVQANDRLTARLKAVGGLVRYNYEMPVIQAEGLSAIRVETKTSSRKKTVKENDTEVTPRSIQHFIQKTKVLVEHAVGLLKWVNQTLWKVHCYRFRWRTEIGVGDAPQTAVCTGMIWALKSWLLGLFCSHVRMHVYPQLHVEPVYAHKNLQMHVDVYVRIRTLHAVLAALKLLKRIIKTRKGLKAWRTVISERMQSM
ncbi:DUF2953 domain-containing protein [Marinicrinis sediminis]|uniref:DUF2953 domain-containing protein n=1 Tax=Marinicrinis sediminis TaxID=1652465 RepID=A0ABW5RCW4_9BACL